MGKHNLNSMKRWGYVLSGIIIMMCLGTVYSYSVFRSSIESMYQIGVTQSGLPYMTALAFYAIFVFLTGKQIDKYKPRTIIFFGSLVVSLGWILSAFAPNIFAFTLTYGLIGGSGVGIVYGVPMTVVAKWFPEKKGLAVGIVLIGFGLSPLITAPLAKALVSQYGLMNAFMILGISFAAILFALAFTFQYPATSMASASGQVSLQDAKEIDTKTMVKSKQFLGLFLNFAIGAMIGLMLVGMTGKVAEEFIQVPAATVPMLMSLFAIFNGLGRPTFGWLTDRFSTRKAMFLSYGMIMTAALLLVLFEGRSVLIFGLAFSIFWFNLGGWLAIAPTATLSLFGTKYYSRNYGVVFMAYGIGAIAGVLSSGLVIDLFQNYQYLFAYVACLALAGMAFTYKLIKS